MGNGINMLQQALQAQIARRQQSAMFDAQMGAREAEQQQAGEQQQQGLAAQLQAGLVRQQMEQAQHQQDMGQQARLQTQAEGARHQLEMDTGGLRNSGTLADQQARADAEMRIAQFVQGKEGERATAANASRERMAGKPHIGITYNHGDPNKPAPAADPRKDPLYLALIQQNQKMKGGLGVGPQAATDSQYLQEMQKKWAEKYPGVPAPGGSIF